MIPQAWERLQETLELVNSFNCPAVLRHTLLPNLNMKNPEGYAKHASTSNATYLEPKAAMSVGYARQRFGYKEMAWHQEIKKFATKLAQASGYNIIDEEPRSNIVLLSQLSKPRKLYHSQQ
jgi:tRNA wybutosine-synthesizing protein 1